MTSIFTDTFAPEVAAEPSEVLATVAIALESVPVPASFKCPITHDIMNDPVVTHDGFVYERAAIQRWFQTGGRLSPVTGLPLLSLTLTPEAPLKRAINEYLDARPELVRKELDLLSLQSAVKLFEEEMQLKLHQNMNPQESPSQSSLNDLIRSSEVTQCFEILKRADSQQINAKDANGYTALHVAAEQGLAPICFAMLNHPEFNQAYAKCMYNRSSYTAAEIAKANRHMQLAAAIEAYLAPRCQGVAAGWTRRTQIDSRSAANMRLYQIDHSQLTGKIDEAFQVLVDKQMPGVRNNMIGEILYPMIMKRYPGQAGKITGMMLEMSNSDLFALLADHGQLTCKIDEALGVLVSSEPHDIGKQMITQRLNPIVKKLYPAQAQKIAGMMLEMSNDELIVLLSDHSRLTGKIDEAFQVLVDEQMPGVRNNMIGEILYPMIKKRYPGQAGKITGMMLEMSNSDLVALLADHRRSTGRVDEAFGSLTRSMPDSAV